MKEFNFTNSLSEYDHDLFFGPLKKDSINDKITLIDGDKIKDMADIWVFVGLFPSRTQAIKNNHGGEIPKGFTDIFKKKRSLRLTIWLE